MGCRPPDSRARRASIPRPSTLPSARRRAGANAGPRPNPSPRRSSRQGRGPANFWRWRESAMASRRAAAFPRSVSPTPRRTVRSTRLAAQPARPGSKSTFPPCLDDACYALKISGGALAPLFRDGELLIVSPHAPARPGDRVAARTLEGELLIAELKDQNARTAGVEAARRRRFRPRAGAGGDRLDVAHHLGQSIAWRVARSLAANMGGHEVSFLLSRRNSGAGSRVGGG